MAFHKYGFYMLYSLVIVILSTTNVHSRNETMVMITEFVTEIDGVMSTSKSDTSSVQEASPPSTTIPVSALPIVNVIEDVLLIAVPVIVGIIIIISITLYALYRSHRGKAQLTIDHIPLTEINGAATAYDNRTYTAEFDPSGHYPDADYQDVALRPLENGADVTSRATATAASLDTSPTEDAVFVNNVAYESFDAAGNGNVERQTRFPDTDTGLAGGPTFESFGKGKRASTDGNVAVNKVHVRPVSVPPPPPYPVEESQPDGDEGEHDDVGDKFDQARTIITTPEITPDKDYAPYATVQKKSERNKIKQRESSAPESDPESGPTSLREEGLTTSSDGMMAGIAQKHYDPEGKIYKDEHIIGGGIPTPDYQHYEEETTRL